MGIFSYTPLKEGKGVGQDHLKLRSPFLFLYLFGTKIWSIIKLNLLFVLCCLPVVTIGAAFAGLTYVIKCFINDEHAFIMHDFFKAFKENFFKATGVFAVNALGWFSLYTVYTNCDQIPMLSAYLFPVLFVNVLILIMDFYIFPMMVTYELSFGALIKNGFIFALIKLPQNVIAAAAVIFAGYTAFYLYPYIGLVLGIIVLPAFLWMFACFYNRNYIKDNMVEKTPENDKNL